VEGIAIQLKTTTLGQTGKKTMFSGTKDWCLLPKAWKPRNSGFPNYPNLFLIDLLIINNELRRVLKYSIVSLLSM